MLNTIDENKKSYMSLVDSYKIEISKLKSDICELEIKVNNVNSDIISLQTSKDSLNKHIDELKVAYVIIFLIFIYINLPE